MKEYSREEWGISFVEYNRLREAVEQGIVLPFTADGYISQLRNHLITVDEIISGFDAGKRFHSEYERCRDSISQEEFDDIAYDVLKNDKNVDNFIIYRIGIDVIFYSRARKQKWKASFDFNDHGKITGKYKYTADYENANQPKEIGDKISRIIRSLLYE